MMKNNLYFKIFACFLAGIVLIFSLFFLISKKERFSENENRYLANFPTFSLESLIQGEYIEKVEDYLQDHFPFRNLFMNMKTNTDLFLGKEEVNGVYFGSEDYLLEKYNEPKNTNRIIQVLNSFYQGLEDVEVNLMLVPTSIAINQERLPKNAITGNQKETIEQISKALDFANISVWDSLQEENKKHPVFYRLDHHWTIYGAYVAYREYCKEKNLHPLATTDFSIQEVTDDFRGTLYSKVIKDDLPPDKIHIFLKDGMEYEVNYVLSKRITNTLYEEKYLTKKDKYSYFLDNNHPLIQITNQKIQNGKELLIIKDSYANSIVPFLLHHYEKIHIIDPRFYKLSIQDYLKEEKVKEVLILYHMGTIDEDLGILSIH